MQSLIANDRAAAEFLLQLKQTQFLLKQASEIAPEPASKAVNEYVGDYRPDESELLSAQRLYQRNRLALVATLLVGVIGGALLGAGFKTTSPGETVTSATSETSPPEWVRLVADYHRLYARETIGSSQVQPVGEVSAALSASLSREVIVPKLEDLGLVFKRVQTLVYQDQPLLQLAYLPETERPIAICILTGKVASQDIKSGLHVDMQYAYWQDQAHAVVVVGDLSRQQMDAVIAKVRRSLFSVS